MNMFIFTRISFFLDSENAILIRISLKAAMGENAVSIIYHHYFLLQ